MCADIHDGQEQKRSIQGPDTEAQDQPSPDHHIQLATHGRSIQKCQLLSSTHLLTPVNLPEARTVGWRGERAGALKRITRRATTDLRNEVVLAGERLTATGRKALDARGS
jgi:hypothetical protein